MSDAQREKRVSVRLRIQPELRSLIDRACRLTGQSRFDFIAEAARERAINVLSDRVQFTLERERYEAFLARLDEPPRPNEMLRHTLLTPAPWEKQERVKN
jgi:uncharacterized protein (DUF1778 family)